MMKHHFAILVVILNLLLGSGPAAGSSAWPDAQNQDDAVSRATTSYEGRATSRRGQVSASAFQMGGAMDQEALLYDDFDSALDTTVWSFGTNSSGSSYSVSNGILNISGGTTNGGGAWVLSNQLFTPGDTLQVLEIQARVSRADGGSWGFWGDEHEGYLLFGANENGKLEAWVRPNSTAPVETAAIDNVDITQWHVYRIEFRGTEAHFYVDGIHKATHTTGMPTGRPMHIRLDRVSWGQNHTLSVDYVCLTAGGSGSPPAPPTNLDARPGLTSITLEWTPSPSADLAGYNVYRSTSPSSDFARVNPALVGGDTWPDTGPGLITGTLHYYYLTAVDSQGQESAPSNTASATFGQVQLSIPDVQGPHGVSVTVPVNIANATGLSIDAMDVYVVYTPTTLTATEVRRTILSLGYGFALNLVQPGVVRVALASGAGGPPLQGPGTLFQLVFDVPGAAGATSSLDFDVAQTDLYGNGDLSQPVPLSLDNGSFTVAAGYILGDLNGDGVVTSDDADLALQIAVGLVTPTPPQQVAGDVNGDGRLNAADAALIMRMAAGLPLLPGGITAQAPGRRTPVHLRLPDVSGAPGQIILVPLNISNAAYVAGADLTVNYDPTLVAVESVQAGDLTQHFTVLAGVRRPGAVRVSLRSQAGHEAGLTGGAGGLAILRFRVNDMAPPGAISRFTLAAGRLNDTYSRDFAGSALQTAVYLFSGQFTVSRRVYLPLVLRPYPFVIGPAG